MAEFPNPLPGQPQCSGISVRISYDPTSGLTDITYLCPAKGCPFKKTGQLPITESGEIEGIGTPPQLPSIYDAVKGLIPHIKAQGTGINRISTLKHGDFTPTS